MPCAFAAGEQQQKVVLMLYSFENEVGLFSEFDESLRATLKSGQIGRIEFHTEFLDLARFPGSQHEEELERHLRSKYSTEKIDLIIPVSLPAINFILSRGERLFPHTPVILCAVDRRWIERLPLPSNVTGVVETTKITKTVAAALQLQPDTRRVVVVGGTLPYERDWMNEIQGDLREYEGKLEITYLTNLSMNELARRLANLPEHTIVLYVMMWRDGAGEYFLPEEVLLRLAQSSTAPIYGVFERFLGSGLVGGDLVRFKTAGAMVAVVGSHVLRGNKPADIPVLSEDDARYMFDWRQLRRWHVNEERLPQGSIVLYKEPSPWEVYKRRTIQAILLIAAEAVLIALLLVQRRKRKRAQDALQQQAAFNGLMTGILARFATCPSSEVDASVEEALQAVAEFTGADHAYVIGISADRKAWGVTHEWCRPNITPRLPLFQNVPMGTNPEIERLILAGKVAKISSPDDLPPDAVAERRHQASEGFLSELQVPFRTKKGISGNIGLHSHAQLLAWSDDDVDHLRMLGDAVANALEHKQSIEELRRSEEKFSKAFHGSPVAMTILSLATGRYIDANRAYERNIGFRADEIIGRTPEELGVYANLVDLERMRQARETQVPLRNQETQYRTKAGDLRVALLSTETIEFGGEPCMLKVIEDITDRKRAETTVREVGLRMLLAQEEERRRVARELHDDFSQRLALLAIDLEQLAQRPAATKHDWAGRVQSMWSQTQELTVDIHRLSRQLHPSKLEDMGLVMAVRSYCHEISKQAKVAVEFRHEDVPRALPKEISLCLYRIVQEALRNVIKHSGSKTAVVELTGVADAIHLAVSDSGRGFDAQTSKGSKGIGLIGMRERVRYIGGELTIHGRPSGGTRVEVRIPSAAKRARSEGNPAA
jgi:PAS domain S-box-containing protein